MLRLGLPNDKPPSPVMTATTPAISIHIVFSVGAPVKNREKSELNDSDAATPYITRTMPAARITSEVSLFIELSFKFLCLTHERSHDSSSTDDSKQNKHNGNHQEGVNETAHGGGSDQSQQPQY
jgi:hypothetical protein